MFKISKDHKETIDPISSQPDGLSLWYLKLETFLFNTRHGLKYLRFTTSSCKDIEITKLEFVEKTIFLCFVSNWDGMCISKYWSVYFHNQVGSSNLCFYIKKI